MRKNKEFGFTLIELMIGIAILGILMVAAVRTYSSYIRQSRRVDGINTILAISMAEERYRSNNTTYGSLAQVWAGVSTSPNGYYTLSISNVTGTSYTITATATGDQANDTGCTSLVITMSNGAVARTPAACWPT